MEDGWIKYFVDNSQELGFDRLVKQKQASWRNGRQSGIEKVQLWLNNHCVTIEGPGKYWQSDLIEARFLINEGKIIQRNLYRQINAGDWSICLNAVINGKLIATIKTLATMHTPCSHEIRIERSWIKKWLKLTLNSQGQTSWEITEHID